MASLGESLDRAGQSPQVKRLREVGGLVRDLYEKVQDRVGNIRPVDGTGIYWRTLRQAILDSRRELVTCTTVANRYYLIVHPDVLEAMQLGGWRRELAHQLTLDAAALIEKEGYSLLDRPLVVILDAEDATRDGEIEYDFRYDPPAVYPYLRLASAQREEATLVAESPFSIGRKPDCLFRIHPQAMRVSGIHGELRETERGWSYFDLDSRNGSFRGGRRLEPGEPVLLEHGERITLGDGLNAVELVFELR